MSPLCHWPCHNAVVPMACTVWPTASWWLQMPLCQICTRPSATTTLTRLCLISPEYHICNVQIALHPFQERPVVFFVVTQRARDALITSLLRQNDVAASFWRNSDVAITSYVRWMVCLVRPITHRRDDVMSRKRFPHHWPLLPMDGQSCATLMFPLFWA